MMALAALGLVVAALGALNLAAALAVILLSRPLDRPGPAMGARATGDARPFVSIHVAAHDEPPAMVIETIEALTRLDYPAFEVVVIDNNTADRATWAPVERRAAELAPAVRFFHRDGVSGAKAGALNIALALADPRATHVAVVDADYQVAPDFLTRAMAACGPDVQFVQFPQDYRHADGAAAVVAELSDYFETFPRVANRAQATLLTGTLSVIAIAALKAAGGWPTGSITEDAGLGVKLWGGRARGLFVPAKVGNGLLPLDLAGLRLQRHRWVSGNVQTLIGARAALMRRRSGALAVIAQLTAWTGFLALPLASLVVAAALRAVGPAFAWPWRAVEGVAGATILVVLAAHLVRAVSRQRPASIAVTMALLWTSSFAWLAVLGGRPLRFRRTPKSGGGAGAERDRARRRAARRPLAAPRGGRANAGMRSLIAIPSYQRAHQIGRAVTAALDQSQDDVMVAVVDDGSTDATEQVCRRWFDHPRFVYLRAGRNLGTAGAKNLALALVPFDAVTFHDSDDIPHRDKLLRQQRTLARRDLSADPCLPWSLTGGGQPPGGAAALDIVLSAHDFLAADGSRARIARTLSLVDDFFPNLQFGGGPLGDWVLVNSGLFRRSLFGRIGGYRDSVEEDRELRNRALMAGANIWFLDEVLLSKYDQPDSLTAAAATGYFSEHRARDRAEVWRAVADWRPGTAPSPVAIDLPDVGLAVVSAPERLAVATDIALTPATRDWLHRALAAAG